MNLERMLARAIVCLAAIAFAFSAGAAETRINAIGEKSREEIVAFFTDNEFGRRPAEAEKPPLLTHNHQTPCHPSQGVFYSRNVLITR